MEGNKELSNDELLQWIKDLESELRRSRRLTQMQLERSCFLQAYLDLLLAERAQNQNPSSSKNERNPNVDN